MEKENKEEGPSKSDKQEISILPPHWDDGDTELYEQFPHEFSIIRQFLDELVAKKQREEEWRSGFHQFCTLTRRWCELYKAETQQHNPSPKSYKAEKQQLQQQHSLSPKSYKAEIQQLQQQHRLSPKLYEAEMRGLFLNDKVTDEGKWFNDFLGFCVFIGKYKSVDEQEWLHRFHQLRSLRRSKDLDEVASDPVEKEWVYEQEWLHRFHQLRSLRRSKDLDEVASDPVETDWVDEQEWFHRIHLLRYLQRKKGLVVEVASDPVEKEWVYEQEWLHRFHQLRSLRRSKDLDEVASDPVEKDWVDEQEWFHRIHLLRYLQRKKGFVVEVASDPVEKEWVYEQEWLHRFHQFRSLRRSKDLDEVASDPVEKEWVDDFSRFCDLLMRRKMHSGPSALAFLLLKIHFYPLTSIKVKRKQKQLSAKEWLEDLDQFCSLFGAQVAKSKQKKLEWLDEFHQLLALFPENGDNDGVDWDQMEQLARAGPVFGNMQSAISGLDDIYAYFATEKSSSSSSPALNYYQLDNANDASIALSPSTLHASLVFSNNVCDPKKVLDIVSQRNTPNVLQTLLFLGEYKHLIHQVPRELFLKLGRHLNVLDLSRTSITELPSSFANLRSLRYLDVSGTPITRLPNCICSFKDMQTLRLRDCYQLLSLPKDLSRLTKLRHLDMDTASQLTSMPPGMGRLTELRTLPVFIVGKDEECNVDEFTNLTALRGSVSILRLENAYDPLLMTRSFSDKKSLIEKSRIEKLELEWTAGSADDGFKSLVVVDFLQPHINIKELRILGYKGVSLAISWIGNPAYVNLKTVKLSNIRCPAVPRLGVLPQLQILHMSEFHDIRKIFYKSAPGSALYPRLNTLVLHSFPDLKEWVPIEDGDFPMLTHLKVSHCPKLCGLPELWLLSSLEDMEISCCSELNHLLLISPEAWRPPLQSLRIIDCPLLEKRYGGIEGMRRELDYIPDIVIME
ncbi:hypothetical protein Syun_002709 [Stephania yunnanensis]|uniref:Disease resistance R13L4/SHOC-2-like LRR domain-containing protein n=1 Tax=Stephania yunnanensis TaxID=152371 RepID=A0AAP0LM00_9MAGN